MKIIISRKGFDSQYGKIPNLILPNNSLLPFPIPSKNSGIKYSEIHSGVKYYENLFHLIKTLGNKNIKENWEAHLDPDLIEESYPRMKGWRPLFGQDSQSLSHLINQNINIGDIFLFFGTFQRVIIDRELIKYDSRSPPQHILFGYFCIGDIIDIHNNYNNKYEWSNYHPHYKINRKPNYIFVSKEKLSILNKEFKGAGIFSKYSINLVLSNDTHKKSLWKLPKWFYPFESNNPKTPLTYHIDKKRWELKDDHVLLQSVDKGQEFVIDANQYPESVEWIQNIIESST